MKKFFETIKNIFKIEELRKRLVYTFVLILIYRFGCFVVLPGIDATMLASLQGKTQEGLVGLLNMKLLHPSWFTATKAAAGIWLWMAAI